MTESKEETTRMSMPLRVLLALAMLVICGVLLLSGRGRIRQEEAEPTADLSAAEQAAEEEPAQTAQQPRKDTQELPLSTDAPAPEETPTPRPERQPIVYDERSYQLVTDMVFAYRKQLPNRNRIIAADVAELKQHNPRLGEAWGGIMEYWDYANNRMELNYGSLPEDLPQDDSLCIVVLGFQLEPDGAMSPEMHGRCELALRAAEQYPNAYLAVTGGGTAYKNPEATEAGVMAAWFMRKGIPEERLILEDQSSTTEENACFTLAILTERYPQVKSLAIVSSDYHLPLGCLLFTEAALLYGCEYGETPYTVVSNLALQGYGLNEYKNPAEQALYVWALADPKPTK